MAPFWSDNDIRRDGNVRFATLYNCDKLKEELCTDTEQGRNVLESVNQYINKVSDTDIFSGEWMLIAHWENVHPSPHGNPLPGIPQDDLNKVRKKFFLYQSCNDKFFR